MRKLIVIVIATLLIGQVAALQVAANGPAVITEEDVTGDMIVCGTTTYTITSGSILVIVHQGASASGNANFTVTIVPEDVVLTDGSGESFSLGGAFWFGGTANAQTGSGQQTGTAFLQIVAQGGGTVDSLAAIFHISPNGTITDFNFGSCGFPS